MFHGWRIVGIAAVTQAVSVGSTFYAYGAFLKPLAAEFEASRLAVTLGLTLMTLVQGSVAPFLGRALDRGSPRAIMIGGILVQAVGFALLSQATAFWQAGLVFVTAIAIGSFLFGPLATATVAANWFVRRRGRALGLTAVGAAVGGGVFPPLAAALIGALGWRGAVLAMAGGLLLLIAPIRWLLVSRPEDLGLAPDGDPPTEPPPAAVAVGPADPTTTRSLVRNGNFWAIAAAVGLAYCPVSVLLAHLVPYATDLGNSPARASLVMSGYALASGLGRVLFGGLADRIDKRLAFWIALGCLALAWANLLGSPPFPALLAAAVASGVAMGGIMPLWGSLVGATFGRAAFGRAMGLMNLLMLPFSMLGAPAAAYLFDRTGSYQLAFTAFLAFFALSAVAIAFLRLPAHEPGTQPRPIPSPGPTRRSAELVDP
jgi:MFS family permease